MRIFHEKQEVPMKKSTLLTIGMTGYSFYNAYKTAQIQQRTKTGQTVLITGASSGIGKDLAYEFAKHGFNVILSSRRKDKLQEIAKDLEKNYPIRTYVFCADLSSANGARQLYEDITKAGIQVDQLVNNAGAGVAAQLIHVSPETLEELINLNIVSMTMLCRLFGKDMAERKTGKILNVASMSSFVANPGLNLYGPSKSYDYFLSETLYGELMDHGVHVSVLCPGPVKTNWNAHAGRKDSIFCMNSKKVAAEAYVGLQAEKLVIIPGTLFQCARTAVRFLPDQCTIRFLKTFQKRLK